MLSTTKKEIDQYFQDNWILTPIQYETAKFETQDTWIGLSFVPIERTSNTCQRKFENSQLRVLCYEANATKVMELADSVNSFADCLTLTTCEFSVGNPDGLGVQILGNDVYEFALIFEVNKLN